MEKFSSWSSANLPLENIPVEGGFSSRVSREGWGIT